MSNKYGEVIDKVIFLYSGYSQEHRFTTQPFHLKKITKAIKNYNYDYLDILTREPLIEHVGTLPVLATAIYPHIQDDDVDLGNALIMLAIHDIGEIVTGDEQLFTKSEATVDKEKKEALKLLPPQYHDTYLDMEEQRTSTGKFAKSIDQIAPDFIDLILPKKIALKYYKDSIGNDISPSAFKKKFKHKYMIWNDFLKNLHLEILNRLDTKFSS